MFMVSLGRCQSRVCSCHDSRKLSALLFFLSLRQLQRRTERDCFISQENSQNHPSKFVYRLRSGLLLLPFRVGSGGGEAAGGPVPRLERPAPAIWWIGGEVPYGAAARPLSQRGQDRPARGLWGVLRRSRYRQGGRRRHQHSQEQ